MATGKVDIEPLQVKTPIVTSPGSDGGGYDCDFIQSPPDDLLCKICHYPTRDAILSVCCGHNFCKCCLDHYLSSEVINHSSCPYCREENFQSVPDKKTARQVLNLQVFCPNKSQGCSWVGELRSMENHLNKTSTASSCGCLFTEVCCSNECGMVIQRRRLEDHLKVECKLRQVKCKYCDSTGYYQWINSNHQQECPKYPMECPNYCKVGHTRRDEMSVHLKECPLAIVKCPFAVVGCDSIVRREEMMGHIKMAVGQHVECNKEAILELERAKISLEEQLKGKVQELTVTKDILIKTTEDNTRKLNDVIKKMEEKEQIVQESMKQLKEMFEQELLELRKEVKLTKQELQNQMKINEQLQNFPKVTSGVHNEVLVSSSGGKCYNIEFENSNCKVILPTVIIPPVKNNVGLFASTTETVTFADLAAASTNGIGGFGFSSNQDFAGAGKPLFITKTDKNVPENFEPTAGFEPVVKLSDIVMSSGKENEIELFSNRGKLYRFDDTVNQWKERGVGNIKILKHKNTGRVRILMRRDQVLKVCCNHVICKGMKLLPHDERSFTWLTLGDLSDPISSLPYGEARAECFTVKFQYVDAATSFQDVFNSFATKNTSTWEFQTCSVAKCVAFGGNHEPTLSSDINMATLSACISGSVTTETPVNTIIDQSDMSSTQFNVTSRDRFLLTPPKFAYDPSKSQPIRCYKFEQYQQCKEFIQTLISNLQ